VHAKISDMPEILPTKRCATKLKIGPTRK